MQRLLRPLLIAVAAIVLAIAAPPARALSFSDTQRGEIERVVKDYLVAHPEVLQEVLNELEKRQSDADAVKHRDGVKQYSQALFYSPRQVTIGNRQGDVTLVEFFDYNCGYCKRALADMLNLMREDAKLRVVLKEFPVLGPGSVEAAQRPGSGRPGPRARRRQRDRPRHGAHRKGYGRRRGQGHARGEHAHRRGTGAQRHSELCHRHRGRRRRGRLGGTQGKGRHRATIAAVACSGLPPAAVPSYNDPGAGAAATISPQEARSQGTSWPTPSMSSMARTSTCSAPASRKPTAIRRWPTWNSCAARRASASSLRSSSGNPTTKARSSTGFRRRLATRRWGS